MAFQFADGSRWRLPLVVVGMLAAGAAPVGAQLRFSPSAPGLGDTVAVAYDGPLARVASDTLRLRTRLRAPGEEWFNHGPRQSTAAVLTRDRDGVFRGAFRLPDEVVFGSFAVEDMRAASVDDNAGRLWELLVHEGGRPLFHALEQRISDLTGRNSELILQTAAAMTELYPDSVFGWHRLARFEGQILRGDALRDMQQAHQARLLAFHDRLSALEEVPPGQMEAMVDYHYFSGLGETETWRYWRDRLDAEYPDYPLVLMFLREGGLNRTFSDDPSRYLRAVEPLWEELLEQRGVELRWRWAMANNALNVAHLADDPAWFVRWITRYAGLPNIEARTVASRVEGGASREDLRPFVLSVLREQVALLEQAPDARRPLRRTREEHRLASLGPMAEVLGAHARVLLLDGDTAAALDTLEIATRMAWVPENWRALGRLRYRVGDTAGALAAFAAVAADPMTATTYRDSIASRMGPGFDKPAWEAAVHEARITMADMVLAHAGSEMLAAPVLLRTLDGRDRTLAELAGGSPITVVFWSPLCFWSRMALPDIQRAAAWSRSHGTRLIVVSETAPDLDVAELMRQSIGEDPAFDLMFDHHGHATAAFRNFGFPTYYIVDRHGRIAFDGMGANTIDRIPLQLVSLSAAPGAAESAPTVAPSEPLTTPGQ